MENYTPVSLLPYTTRPLYNDSPVPHNVSAISPLDPQLFTTIGQHAKNLVDGTPDPRYHSSEVILWLDGFVRSSAQSLAQARASAGRRATTPEFRRAEADILILNGLGTYFADLFRAALFYSVHEQTGDPAAATQSLAAARSARQAWVGTATHAATIYRKDISYGGPQFRRGSWADRTPAIDQQLAELEQHFAQASPQRASAAHAIAQVTHPAPRPAVSATHEPAATFHPGAELRLSLSARGASGAVLWYRHVSHAERWLSAPMQASGDHYTAAIPSAYTDSPFPLQYYFELRTSGSPVLYPGFNATLSSQPYFAVHTRA